MSARCPVCSHESRPAIEQAVLNGKAKTRIALDFGFTYTRRKDQRVMGDHKVIQNHLDRCMGEAFQKARDSRELASGEAMATRLRAMEAEVTRVLERANTGTPVMVGDTPMLDADGNPVMRHDNRLILAAVREARGNIELLAKLAGKVEEEPADLDTARKHLRDPKARKLLADLEALAAQSGE